MADSRPSRLSMISGMAMKWILSLRGLRWLSP